MSEHAPVCYEKLLDSFREWALSNMETCPEVRSLVLVTDWEVGQNDFPAGMICGREKSPAAQRGVIVQIGKMLINVADKLPATTNTPTTPV